MNFDPQRNRWVFFEGGGLRRAFEDRDIEGKPIGNYAYFELGDVVNAWLAGLSEEIRPVISRSVDWLDQAIERGEVMGESANFHSCKLHWTRAIGHWMLNGTNADADWDAARRYELGYWDDDPSSAAWTIQHCLDDYMAFALQARKYQEGIDTYERLVGAKKQSLKKIIKPRDYAYAACLNQTQPQFDGAEMFAAGRRMLQASMEDPWLARGQSLRGAMWLKIVYWDKDVMAGREPSLTPLQTVLKAYENMPDVEVPDFVSLT